MGCRLLFCRCCSWNRSLDFFRQFPGSKVSTKCLHFLHQHGVKCSRIKRERVIFSATYSQRKNSKVLFVQPQSTSSAAIGKTTTEKEENLLKEETTDNEADEEEWREQSIDWRKLPQQYMKLSKFRLTGLVVITEMAGYLIAPGAIHLGTFLWAGLGTWLCSGSANAINQWLEVPFDSQMSRTQNRVLVRGRLSPLHVVTFGAVTGALGLTVLATQVNGLTAVLGASTLLLYTSIYTPMKRLSIVNTWVGSVVGALPPLMGWAACTGGLDIGALLLAGILYSWQFPHFNALSWNLRADYSRAGYRMMCVTDAALCRRVTLRHCVALLGLCTLLPAFDVTTWWLALDSLPLNIWNTYLGYRFYRDSDNRSARRLFRFSLPYLPVLMLLILLHKKTKDEWTEDERVVES